MLLICLGFYLFDEKRRDYSLTGDNNKSGVFRWKVLRPWMITGLLGQILGFVFMVSAPGNAVRAQAAEEEHSGLFAYISRFQKITLAVRENFLLLLIIGLLLFIIVRYQRDNWKVLWRTERNGLTWFFVFLATCYALVMTPEPMPRAYFGAGIFLIISVTQFYADVSGIESVFAVLKTGLLSVMLLLMFFAYMDSGANLARIYREYNERDVYLIQKAEEGVEDVTIPMLRPDFETKYSDGYNSDIHDDPGYWINVAYATYYGFNSVSGVPREDWTEY